MFDPKETGAEADAIINQLANRGEGEASEPTDPTLTLVEGGKSDDDDLQGEAEDTPSEEDTTQGVEAEAETGTNELAEMQRQLEQANQRWKTMQGMMAKKDEELDSMRQIVANLTDVVQQSSSHDQGVKPAEPEYTPQVTPDDIETFGDDWRGFVSRVAVDTLQPMLSSLEKRIDEKLGRVEGSVQGVARTSQQAAGSVFRNELSKLAPGYEQLNTDAEFAGWLDQVDPFTSLPRRELFNAAVKAQDANRVAAFFNNFPGNKPAEPEPQQARPAASEGKAALVAPGKSRAGTPAATEDGKRIWTHADIGRLYDDKQAGRISKADFDKLERDMFKAQREGRIASPR